MTALEWPVHVRDRGQARRKARAFPAIGAFIAEVEIPEDARVVIERTRGAGHYTVWGNPSELLAHVISVVRI